MSLETVLISEKDSVNLNELQGHVNNWREIISDFAKGGFSMIKKINKVVAEFEHLENFERLYKVKMINRAMNLPI